MAKEDNKNVVRDVFAAIAAGDTEKLDSLLTGDAVWWITGSTKISGLHSKREFLELVPSVFKDAAGPIKLEFSDIIAEEDRVSIVAKGNLPLKNGKVFASDYHFLFKIRDGKVANVREYLDTRHFNSVFA